MKFWWLYALLGALFAGLMPLFVKRGLSLPDGKTIDSDLATAVRVVMLVAPVWLFVWYKGVGGQMGLFSGTNWLFLALSAAATGLSWLFQFKALSLAAASRVMPIDKFSLVITVALGVMFLGEQMTWRLGLAVVLIVIGTLLAIKPADAKPVEAGAAARLSATTETPPVMESLERRIE